MRKTIAIILFVVISVSVDARDLFKTTLIQAAPGQLLELMDALKNRAKDQDKTLYLLRHSQGDHWDLLLMEAVDGYSESTLISTLGDKGVLADPLDHLIAWKEELFVQGPSHREFRRKYENAGFFHIEIFVALAGKRKELFQEREMENKYLEELKRGPNQIFVKTMGAKWDMFTIGFYKDLKDYAKSSDSSAKESEEAAQKAGFTGAGSIGAYLRRFISEHHDTLAVKAISN